MAWNKHISIKMLDLAVLLYHLHKAAQDQEIGFEDATQTLESLTHQLNKTLSIDSKLLESALWSANLMDEKGNFWHPGDLTFDEFARRIVGKFNRYYNTIEE